MKGTSTALVIAVEQAEAVLGRFRALHDPASAGGGIAHVTLLYPFLKPRALTVEARQRLRAVCAARRPFPFRLATTGRFPGVLYLAPEPAAPFEALTTALWESFPSQPPYEGRFARIVPHLQIAQGDDEAELDALEDQARALLTRIGPIRATARQIQLVDESDGIWRVRWRFRLGSA